MFCCSARVQALELDLGPFSFFEPLAPPSLLLFLFPAKEAIIVSWEPLFFEAEGCSPELKLAFPY
jgi:hypothetical protein